MAENGEDKLLAVVRHITKTLGKSGTMTDDILQIFSSFDDRLSRDKLSERIGRAAAAAEEDGPPGSSDIKRVLRSLDRQISRFVASERPIWSNSDESMAFLDAVDSLLSLIRDMDSVTSEDKMMIQHAEDLIHQAMIRLKDEFRALLDSQTGGRPSDPISSSFDSDGEDSEGDDQIPVAQPVTDYDVVIDALPSGTVADLHDIAKRMVAAGFEKECAQAYSICRRDFLEESISRLGLRLRTTEEVYGMPWPDIEEEIGRWVKVINVAVRILFPSERRLCDRVFAGLAAVVRVAVFILFPSERRLCNRVFAGLAAAGDLSLAETCRGAMRRLLAFPEAAATASRSPERLFGLMDVYEALRELVPEIASVFSGESSSVLPPPVRRRRRPVAAAVRDVFAELENRIRRDPVAPPVAGGGLHPMTRYVVNYLRAACRSRRTLEEIMNEDGGAAAGDQIGWAMDLLLGNLESKSKCYRNPAQSFLFLLNNGWYISQKVKDGELGILLGEDWIRGQTASVRRWRSSYQRTTWGEVIDLLNASREASSGSFSPAPASSLGEKLQLFNELFGETYRNQTGWVVADERLATELRASAIELVLPAYQSFLRRLRSSPAPEKSLGRLVMYSPADVRARINRLFKWSARNL
ncbi:unnamed protein product [Spirodela intermedia]|uniref:Exocyst subunit Exo70 family protein n=1 Tax=Spirodela intermedia TaxID=51605 RepID=A0A7I8IG95_SPIIN|nr:unnamed protein product [Spirodela intermedia]CAA6656912.1 unnamed protein product [Spirodela intermedia]